MEVSKNTRIAYAEINSFIELLPEKEKTKIPNDLVAFFRKEKDKETTKKLSLDIPIEEQNLNDETWNLIALLYLKYLCEDENEKKELEKIYEENDRKYMEEIKEKYDPENVFKERDKVQNIEKNLVEEKQKNLPIEIPKETIIQKIKRFINKLLRKKHT